MNQKNTTNNTKFMKRFLIIFTRELINKSKNFETKQIESLTLREILRKKAKKRLKKKRELIKPYKINREFVPSIQERNLFPNEFVKIIQLINDPRIRKIECLGENKNLEVSLNNGEERETTIKLTKEEIINIIKKMSELTRIPIQEGIFHVQYNNIDFAAIISEFSSPKFIIEKLQ